jgi:Zn-dependent oligopeptidase
MLSDFNIEAWARLDFYSALKEYQVMSQQNGAFSKLDFESQRYVNKVISDMESSGIGLPLEKRDQVVKLNKEISTLSTLALDNINHDDSYFEISELDLVNAGNKTINELDKVSGKEGFRKFLLKSPTASSVLRLCENDEVK